MIAGRSPVTPTEDQKAELKVLAQGADRAEADRAHALLLTLDGWTSADRASLRGAGGHGSALAQRLARGGVDARGQHGFGFVSNCSLRLEIAD